MSVFGRLNYNFDSAKFGANNELTDGQKLSLNYPSPLYTWQASDLSGSSVGNYFQNPHSANLTLMTTYTNQLLTYSNTQSVTYNSAPTEANTLYALANNLLIEISSFTDHTNRMSGATESTNKLTTPDYQIAMSIGRQVLQICNQVDGIQNNAPILGNFTSLAVVQDVSNSVIQLASSAATLNASLSIVDGNTYSSISRASMNTIIASAQTAFNLLNSRRVGDTTFYTNSISLIQDYNTILQFSNLGVNSSYLIKDLNIGTTKLQNYLQNSVPSGFPNNIYSGTSTTTTSTGTGTTTSTGVLSVTGVVPGTYTISTISVDAYGRVTFANTGVPVGLTGATGSTGIQGASGSSTGSTGPQGFTGASGSTGIQGATGSTGIQGASGSTGIQGASGSTGVGATGSTGIQGASGSTGIQGASGSTGIQGASGSSTGSTGPQGFTGATGSTGPTANTLTTTNFSISESGGKLIFKYGATVIASMGANGIFISANNVIAGGTP